MEGWRWHLHTLTHTQRVVTTRIWHVSVYRVRHHFCLKDDKFEMKDMVDVQILFKPPKSLKAMLILRAFMLTLAREASQNFCVCVCVCVCIMYIYTCIVCPISGQIYCNF